MSTAIQLHRESTNLLRALDGFLSLPQKRAIRHLLDSSEAAFYRNRLSDVARLIETMPVTYEQDGKGDRAVAYLHYFVPNGDLYVTELDMDDQVSQVMGYATQNGHPLELGYNSITEWIRNNAELDLHWTPVEVRAMKAAG